MIKGGILYKALYIGNLQWGVTEEELKETFSRFGEVSSVKIIKDFQTNKSKGYGFVSMRNADEAMKSLNGTELRGRTLKVNDARRSQRSTS